VTANNGAPMPQNRPTPYPSSVGMLTGSILDADLQAGASRFAHSLVSPRNRR
jgi:hypothetical protein